jgi:peroxiredoxin/uncharacterized GH25 family protein
MLLRWGVSLAIAINAFSLAGADAQRRPDLTGVVKDRSDRPLSDATVFIYTAGPKEGTGVLCPSCYADCRKRTNTDADGKFSIEELDPSLIFRVLVVAKGFQPEFVAKVDPAEKPIEVALKPISGGETPNKRMRGVVLDGDGKPVSGAVVSIRGVSRGTSTRFGGNKEVDPVAVSDDAGEFTINSAEPFDAVGVDVEAAGFAKGIFQRLATGGEVHMLKLDEGVTVKGRVLHDGKPLRGIDMGIAGANRRSEIFVGDYTVATDTNGAFLFPNLPARTEYFVYGRMKSLGEKGSIPSRRVKTGEVGFTVDFGDLVAQPGYRLEGVVRLTGSNSVPEKTQVMVSRKDAWDQLITHTDGQGRFKLTGIPPETVSVHSRVPGYRHSLRNASLDVQNPSSLIGRLRTNKTDLVIELEPGDRRERLDGDWQAQREEPLHGAEATRPEGDLKVTGTVTDAETGKPLPGFTVTEGRQDQYEGRMTWSATRKKKHENGTFEMYLTKQRLAPAVLIEAEGYLPQASAAITNAESELAFALKKGNGPGGVLLKPNGEPAAGVTVYLTDMRNGVYVDGENLKVRETMVRSTKSTVTNDKGRFSFAPMLDAFSAIVVDDAGYLEKRVEDLLANGELRLRPWARVEGKLLIGARPGTNEAVRLWPAHIPYENEPRNFAALQIFLNVKTDDEGRFVFERVPPMHVEVYHEPKVRDSRMGTTPMAQTTKLTLRPGETRQVTLGGKGRPVVGRILVEGYEGTINWRSDVYMMESNVPQPEGIPDLLAMSREFSGTFSALNTDEEKAAAREEFNRARKAAIEKHKQFYATEAGRAHHFLKKRYALNFAQDGSFRIEDVPGGRYKLKMDLREGDSQDISRYSKPRIAEIEKDFEVPDSPGGRSDEPYDLGEISVQARTTMKAGKTAPDFEVKTVDGKTIKLSDFRGKYVLLDFWAVWCGPCVAETPNLKDAYAAFKDDPRFAIVGLSLDPKESSPRDYAKKNELGWIQGFLGDWSKTDLPKQYGVEGIPAIFLIGPDGQIVSTGLRGSNIKSAIQAALQKK